ncbi:MAG: hypothetical protein WD875_19395 [Pirellulales bacterium]
MAFPMALASVLAAAVLVVGGCSKGDGKAGGDDRDEHHPHHHGDDPTVGPHGGPIIEWGEHKYHVEITFDRAKQQATVYVLDHDVKNPEPVAVVSPTLKLDGMAELIPLTPLPLEGESTEKSSRYVATNAALGAAEEFRGEVSGKIDGTQYFEQFKESDAKKADDHDGHKPDAPTGDEAP